MRILLIALALTGCASLQVDQVAVGVPEGPETSSSLQSFVQGLNYIRENPTQRADERVQRFVWLDQWMLMLKSQDQLQTELEVEFIADLEGFVSNEPALGERDLRRLEPRARSNVARNIVHYHLYQVLMREQKVEPALAELEKILDDGLSDYFRRAQDLLELQRSEQIAESRKIGVMLPLKGRFKNFGLDALNAIQLVASLSVSEGIEFLVVDSSDPKTLLDNFQRLALDEQVSVIIGPVTTQSSEFIFERAQILSIPVVSLSPRENLEMFGPYSFRSTLTLEDQVERLAEIIDRDLRAKNVAILYPDNRYGWDATVAAQRVFQQKGIRVPEIQIYEEGTTDFKAPLQKIARLDFPKLRAGELCPDEDSGEAAVEGCVGDLTELAPVLNFEVLLVPDFADTAGLLLPTLPFLRLYGVQVVGLSGFHDPRLIQRGQQHAEGVIFVDGFDLGSQDLATRFFVNRYRALTSQDPSKIAAEAFDISMLLVDMMKQNQRVVSRELVFQSLRRLQSFPGVTGEIFSDGQQIRKRARAFTVRDGEFQALR